MSKTIDKEEKEFYKKLAKDLQAIRPVCHMASIITTTIFIVLWVLRYEFTQFVFDFFGAWTYVFAFVLVGIPVYLLEQNRLSPLIDDAGKAIALGHSFRVGAALVIISLPLIVLTTTTSWVGSAEAGHASADATHQRGLNEMLSGLKSNSHNLHLSREKELAKSRKVGREAIKEQHAIKLQSRIHDNKRKHTGWQESKSIKKMLDRDNQRDSAIVERILAATLEKYDKETEKKLASIHGVHNDLKQDESLTATVLVETTKEVTSSRADRYRWIGRIFGFISVSFIFISIIAAFTKHYVMQRWGIRDSDLVRPSPTQFAFIMSYLKSIFSRNTRGNSSNRVGVNQLKNKLNSVVKDLDDPDKEREALQESIRLMGKLRDHGVNAKIGQDKKIRYHDI